MTPPRSIAVILGDLKKANPFEVTPNLAGTLESAIAGLREALNTLPEYRFTYLTDHDRLVEDLTAGKDVFDLAMNLCDAGFGNNPRRESHVPALLELIGIPYTGGGPRCLEVCYDKLLVQAIADDLGVAVPLSASVRIGAASWKGPWPAFVKPNFADGSFGITRQSVVRNEVEVEAAMRAVQAQFGYDDLFVAQEFLPGADLSVGILGNPPGHQVLPILEESYVGVPDDAPRIGSYEAKWDSEDADSPYLHIDWVQAVLPPETEQQIALWSAALFTRLECRDYARFDWRLDARGAPRLLEVNPNPGWDYWTYLATMAGWAGVSYPEMLRRILEAALLRRD
jgi:D-alanine-D-alanine ligase